MAQVLLLLVVALTVAAVVFGVTVLVTGRDPGLAPVEPDGRAVPLPGSRPLRESDVGDVRFDTTLRGYRMAQVDQAMRRAAYDIGYKSELIGVLEAEVTALREGRTADADALARTREQAAAAAESPDDATGADGRGADPVDAPSAHEPGTVTARDADAPNADPPNTDGTNADMTNADMTNADMTNTDVPGAGDGGPVDPAGGRGPAVRSEPA
ncbi:DivIVA domain-containing protein [Micromonospora sp. RTGN7]|uniref:DivIVA domain-containing protein n=1 Tax=Micromonospora sp. RTGN7 TaxID=3016526 RepID=UPI0029FEE9E7|nr:DivIVA domain-containing protein [Micromonospora sp. RTGN7]